MPNYVTNIVTLTGKPEDVEKAIEYVMPDGGEYGQIDFQKLIPMPQTLHVISGSQMSDAISVYLSAVNPDTEDMGYEKLTKEKFDEKINLSKKARGASHINTNLTFAQATEMSKSFFEASEKRSQHLGSCYADEDLVLYGETVLNNIEQYGCTDWFEWCSCHWGTKWNACSSCGISRGENEIRFDTAWACPHPVLAKWSELFPDITFNVKWADEDVGNNCGEWEIIAGDGEPEYKCDYAFAAEILGIDISRNFTTNAGYTYSIDDIGPINEDTIKKMKKDYHVRVDCLKKSSYDGMYYYDESDDEKFIKFLERLKKKGFDLDSLV